jgi:hypothetical protein
MDEWHIERAKIWLRAGIAVRQRLGGDTEDFERLMWILGAPRATDDPQTPPTHAPTSATIHPRA